MTVTHQDATATTKQPGRDGGDNAHQDAMASLSVSTLLSHVMTTLLKVLSSLHWFHSQHNAPLITFISLPTKRSSSSAGTNPMKKAKSHAPLDDTVFDPSSMALDDDLKPFDDHHHSVASRGLVATNLACKKASPPQPPKKFLIKFHKGLQEEHERCLIYFDASIRKPLIATAKKQLLECHIPAILDKGYSMLMDENRIEDLQRMYSLFSRVNALESLRQALSSYIRRTGQGIVMDAKECLSAI